MKQTALHFVSGLPRSGSTLLAGILKQNPRFHAAMSGPVGGVMMGAFRAMSADSEYAQFLSDDQKMRILCGIFDGYYGVYESADVIFDTNRLWCAQLPLLSQLYPEAKVIACVRNPAWIFDSVEKLSRKNPLHRSKIFGDAADRATVYERAEALLRSNRLIGSSINALKEAYYGQLADRLLLVEYDILCQRPKETIGLIYDFIGEPVFAHNFGDVTYEAEHFDQQLDTPGLHTVSGPVRFSPRETCLPPDIFDSYAKLDFWRTDNRTKAARIVQKDPAT